MKNSYRKKQFFKILSLILSIIYFTWRIFFALPTRFGIIAIVAAVIMLVCEIFSTVEAFVHMWSSAEVSEPDMPQIPTEWYPDVDVFIATHNESTDILYKTINGCKHMRYPDPSKVHIWICDDGYRMEMKELAEKMHVGWQGLQNNKLAKAGNLNNALSHTSAPLVVTFDADMIPTRDFLMETVPYFFLPKMKKLDDGTWVPKDESEIDPEDQIGFIQTPQNFYNADLFQYNLYAEEKVPNEQDYFFKEINVARNKTNSPIYAGSNTVISRKALEEVGGIATGTITEDFETGIHIQGKGYKCYAISKVLAHGLAPDTVESLIKQRERWGRGCIYSLRKMHIWTNREIPFRSKITYWACELYWWTFLRRLVFILSPILFAVFSIPVIDCTTWELLLFWLPTYLVLNYTQNLAAGAIRTTSWSNVIDTIMFPYLVVPIFMEAIGIQQHKFHVTRKDRVVSEDNDLALAVPYIVLLVMSAVAICFSFTDLIKFEAPGTVVIIYWLLTNGYSLLMAVFFMRGRRNLRMTERYDAQIPVKISTASDHCLGETIDISEDGICLRSRYIKVLPEETVTISLHSEDYEATVEAHQLYVTEEQSENGSRIWRYAFKIDHMTEENRAEYFQMIYDRDPSLPTVTAKNDSAIGNITDNIRLGTGGLHKEQRRNYRIHVNRYINDDQGNLIYVYDYNNAYVVLNGKSTGDRKQIKLKPAENVTIRCTLEHAIDDFKYLFKVENGEELLTDEAFSAVLFDWLSAEENSREEILK